MSNDTRQALAFALACHIKTLRASGRNDGLVEDMERARAALAAQPVAGAVAQPVAWLCSISHPDWLEVCERDAPGAFPVYATHQAAAHPVMVEVGMLVPRYSHANEETITRPELYADFKDLPPRTLLYARLQPQAAPAPEPSAQAVAEATDAMVKAGAKAAHDHSDDPAPKFYRALWSAMLAASPKPQQAVPLTDEHVNAVVRSVQPHLSTECKAWRELTETCRYWLQAERGIAPKAAQP